MNIQPQTFIISAEREELTKEQNLFRTEQLKQMLIKNKIQYTVAQGCYKGQTEIAFVCIAYYQEQAETIKLLAFTHFKQESVLYIDSNGEASLDYATGYTQMLGGFRQVTESQALASDAYSKVDGRYYLAGGVQ